MERSRVMLVVAAMALAIMVMVQEADATRFIVGGNMGWTTNVNYTVWAQSKFFYNGDWLFFVYDRKQMNVLEVNKTDYESCNSDHPLHNWTTGAGRDVVPLNMTRQYYFIGGKGFCYGGMKLAVRVENLPPPPTSSPLNEKSGSPSSIYRSPIVLPPASGPSPTSSPLIEESGSPSSSYRAPPPTSSALNEKSGSPSSIYRGHIVLPAVFAIGALWDPFVRIW